MGTCKVNSCILLTPKCILWLQKVKTAYCTSLSGLHFLLRQKRSSEKEIQFNLEIIRLQSMVHHRIYPLLKVTQNIAQYPLHHVTYSPAKFEVTMYNCFLGVDTFIRTYII